MALLAAVLGTAFLYFLWRNTQETRARATRRAAFLDEIAPGRLPTYAA